MQTLSPNPSRTVTLPLPLTSGGLPREPPEVLVHHLGVRDRVRVGVGVGAGVRLRLRLRLRVG